MKKQNSLGWLKRKTAIRMLMPAVFVAAFGGLLAILLIGALKYLDQQFISLDALNEWAIGVLLGLLIINPIIFYLVGYFGKTLQKAYLERLIRQKKSDIATCDTIVDRVLEENHRLFEEDETVKRLSNPDLDLEAWKAQCQDQVREAIVKFDDCLRGVADIKARDKDFFKKISARDILLATREELVTQLRDIPVITLQTVHAWLAGLKEISQKRVDALLEYKETHTRALAEMNETMKHYN